MGDSDIVTTWASPVSEIVLVEDGIFLSFVMSWVLGRIWLVVLESVLVQTWGSGTLKSHFPGKLCGFVY